MIGISVSFYFRRMCKIILADSIFKYSKFFLLTIYLCHYPVR